VRPELDAARAVALLPLLSTALHAVRTADVGPGTRVLVHRASSPLGAALAFASRMAGAEVIAAYADPGHRAALERLATVTHDGSRPLVDAVLEATHGAGVDVAFALGASSEMVPALAVEGQIVTFAGETDGLSLPVAELARRRISVQALHVEGVRAERPEAIARVLTSAVDMLARGDALPLAHEVVPLSRASTVLGGAAHDKVVAVSFDDPRAVVRLPQSEAQRAASAPEGAVSVLVADPSPLADWVHGLLDNAHGPTPAAGASRPRVVVASASDARDALRRGALAAWLGDALPHGVTLQTVAFVLAADEMTPADAFAAPAIDVATELHAFAADRSARAIVSFGTLASVLGELGHAGAALVGAALDALATRSRARGLPAAHIALGSLEHGASLGPSRGVRPLPAERAEALVRRVLAAIGAGEADFARALAIADVDGRQWTEARPQVSGSRFLARLARSQKSESPRAEGGAPALRDALRDASGEARIVLLEDYIAEQTSLVLRLPPSDLDRAAPLKTYGVDSVTALEIRNRLEGALGMRLTATLLWTYPTVEALAAHLATKVASVPSDAPTPGGALAASHTVEPRENRAPSPDPAEHVPSDEAELEAALRAVESLLD
jgi:acyl carrier protein